MASDISICNRALVKLGATRISSLTENSHNAKACSQIYEAVRDAELEEHPWNFAVKLAELAADSVAPIFGRANSFTLPADFIKLISDYPELNSAFKDWLIQDGKIYTNDEAPLQIRYIRRHTNPNNYSPLFCEALASALALELCELITQSNTKKQLLDADYTKIIRRAKRSNAFAKPSAQPPEDPWLSARR